MKVSSSMLDSYYGWCKQKTELQFFKKIKSKIVSIPAETGKLVHNEISQFWEEFELNLKTYKHDLERYFNHRLKHLCLFDPNINKEIYINFQKMFGNFIYVQSNRIDNYTKTFGNNLERIKDHFYPKLSEKYGSLRLMSGAVYFGFVVDSIFKQVERNYIILDWKTDKKTDEAQFKTHVKQLNRYKICAEEVYDFIPNEIAILFLSEINFYKDEPDPNYSLEDEVEQFLEDIDEIGFPVVPDKEKYKCCTENYQCEMYPKYCKGAMCLRGVENK